MADHSIAQSVEDRVTYIPGISDVKIHLTLNSQKTFHIRSGTAL